MKNLKSQASEMAAKKLKSYADGGDTKSSPSPTSTPKAYAKGGAAYADGGSIGGGSSRPNLGKHGHKGGKKGGTHVNVIVGGPKANPMPMAGPPPVDPDALAAAAAAGGGAGGPPPPPPAMAGPGGPGGGAPMPPMRKGGKVSRKSGGAVKVIDDGAGSGEGRLEKIKAYGSKAKH